MLPVRVAETRPRAPNRPVRQDLYQASLGPSCAHAIPLDVMGDAEPVRRSSNADIGALGGQRAAHRHLKALPALVELQRWCLPSI